MTEAMTQGRKRSQYMGESPDELLGGALRIMRSFGEVQVLRYPDDRNSRSMDLALHVRDKGSIIVKVAIDVSDVGKAERDELKRVSAAIGVNALIVARTRYGHELIEGVIYDVDGAKVTRVETIVNAAVSEEYPAIYEDKDGFKVKLRGDVLKALRMGKGYSLGAAAEKLKVTRRTVYDYEREAIRPTIDVAERLVREFGDDIVRPINLFDPSEEVVAVRVSRPEGLPVDSKVESLVVEKLKEHGYRFTHARRSPLDIAASKDDLRLFLTIPHPREGPRPVSERSENMTRLAVTLSGRSYVVVERDRFEEAKGLVDDTDSVLTVDELSEFLGEAYGAKSAGGNRQARGG